jgi:hypothetical protein
MFRYCQIECLYENGFDSDGSPLEVKKGVSMTDEVKNQHEIINLVSREANNREGRRCLQADQCATFCACRLELPSSKEPHDCVGSSELHKLDIEGSDGSSEEGPDRDQCVVCGVELQRGEVRYCYNHRPERKNYNDVEWAKVTPEELGLAKQLGNGTELLADGGHVCDCWERQ